MSALPWRRRRSESSITENQLEKILSMDREVFEADRGALLRSLHERAPAFTVAIEAGRNLAGYILGRRGRSADHLGPWMARDPETASRPLELFMARSARGRIIADCIKSNPFAGALLRSMGFEVLRPLRRMARGSGGTGHPELLCAILGREFG